MSNIYCMEAIPSFHCKFISISNFISLFPLLHCCRNYGLTMRFPEYFKRLRMQNCNQTLATDCGNQTNLQFYQDTLFVMLASLPSIIAGILLITLLGGKILGGEYVIGRGEGGSINRLQFLSHSGVVCLRNIVEPLIKDPPRKGLSLCKGHSIRD